MLRIYPDRLVAAGLVLLLGSAAAGAQGLGSGSLADTWAREGGGTLVMPSDQELEGELDANFAPPGFGDTVAPGVGPTGPAQPPGGAGDSTQEGPSVSEMSLVDLTRALDEAERQIKLFETVIAATRTPEDRQLFESRRAAWVNQAQVLRNEIASR